MDEKKNSAVNSAPHSGAPYQDAVQLLSGDAPRGPGLHPVQRHYQLDPLHVYAERHLPWWSRAGRPGTGPLYAGRFCALWLILVVLYVLSLAAGTAFNQLMAIITQGSLAKMREKMFNGMQDLPIKYFDTHNHGDVMSYYTNDIDTLRQMISQSIPQLDHLHRDGASPCCAIMLYFSVWMTLVVLLGVFFMVLVTKKVGGSSSKYFIRMQQSIGRYRGLWWKR